MKRHDILDARSTMKTATTIPAGFNEHARRWVEECATLCQPDSVHWCDGSNEERAELTRQAASQSILIELNQTAMPGCYLHRSNPNDTARTEHCTFICTPTKASAGPTNNWMAPADAYQMLRGCFAGSMRGRTMYVVPFLMGHPGSPLAKIGIELTDSLYVVLSMGIMTRMGRIALEELGDRDTFTRCLHSVGECDPNRRYICHFPQDNTIWSYGSGYGGNALLGKKCLSLRIGSYLGHEEGWLAEHMLIMGVTDPRGQTTYVTGAFPSACGKTNLAMLTPPPSMAADGWKIETLGDDIAWMYIDGHGHLRALNPEAGYFGVVPGTNRTTNPNAIEAMARNAIYTNVALRPDGTAWWEGHDEPAPAQCTDWTGQPWTPSSGRKAAHPNSRFTAPVTQNPAISPLWDDPSGVPISAIIFGGRRSKTLPLVVEAFNWTHGAYLGAMMGSETTAAASGQTGVVRRDPMAMLPFCGYNMGAYFAHWLSMQKRLAPPPRIFHVNWFRTDEHGKFLWPGFGENLRILQWILDRCHGRVDAVKTPIGWMPQPEDINLDGLEIDRARFEQAQAIDREAWRKELSTQEELFVKLGGDMPKELLFERELLLSRL